MVRVPNEFINLVSEKQKDYSRAINKPITFVQATKILVIDYRKSNSGNVTFYKTRNKRVLL
jgi:hypothetical protein